MKAFFLSVTFAVFVSVPVTGKNLWKLPLPLLLSFQFPINILTDTQKIIPVLKETQLNEVKCGNLMSKLSYWHNGDIYVACL